MVASRSRALATVVIAALWILAIASGLTAITAKEHPQTYIGSAFAFGFLALLIRNWTAPPPGAQYPGSAAAFPDFVHDDTHTSLFDEHKPIPPSLSSDDHFGDPHRAVDYDDD